MTQAILLHALAVHAVTAAGHLSARPGTPRRGVPTPRRAPPGLAAPVNTILGWGKWGVLVCGVAGLLICGGKMAIGHRNRSSNLAADGGHPHPVGAPRPEPGRRLGRHRGSVPVRPARRAPAPRCSRPQPPSSPWPARAWPCCSPAAARRRRSPRRPPARQSAPSPAASTAVPQVSLAGLRWSAYHGVELPSSPAAGPRDTTGGLASGFADTPLGALLAALNIAVRANAQWGPGIFGPTIRGQVTGPYAAALLAGCQAAYAQASQAAHVTGGAPLGNAYVTEEAFRWVA